MHGWVWELAVQCFYFSFYVFWELAAQTTPHTWDGGMLLAFTNSLDSFFISDLHRIMLLFCTYIVGD
jgi:hypothetical protein